MPVLPIFPADHARPAGKPYQPSNGTEGDYFHAAACARCTKWERAADPNDYDRGCHIEAYALAYGIDDVEYPDEWIIGPDGQPTCTAFDQRQGE